MCKGSKVDYFSAFFALFFLAMGHLVAQHDAIEVNLSSINGGQSDVYKLDALQDGPFFFLTAKTNKKGKFAPKLHFRLLGENQLWSEWTPFLLFHEAELVDRYSLIGGDFSPDKKCIQFLLDGQPDVAMHVYSGACLELGQALVLL